MKSYLCYVLFRGWHNCQIKVNFNYDDIFRVIKRHRRIFDLLFVLFCHMLRLSSVQRHPSRITASSQVHFKDNIWYLQYQVDCFLNNNWRMWNCHYNKLSYRYHESKLRHHRPIVSYILTVIRESFMNL